MRHQVNELQQVGKINVNLGMNKGSTAPVKQLYVP